LHSRPGRDVEEPAVASWLPATSSAPAGSRPEDRVELDRIAVDRRELGVARGPDAELGQPPEQHDLVAVAAAARVTRRCAAARPAHRR
jgi:hypothetical protein